MKRVTRPFDPCKILFGNLDGPFFVPVGERYALHHFKTSLVSWAGVACLRAMARCAAATIASTLMPYFSSRSEYGPDSVKVSFTPTRSSGTGEYCDKHRSEERRVGKEGRARW